MLKKVMMFLSAVVLGSAVYAADFPLKVWESADSEGVISDLQENNFLYTVTADYRQTGNKYNTPIGWVRVRTILNGKSGLNVSGKYSQFEFEVTIEAGEQIKTPVSVSVASFSGKKDAVNLPQELESGKSYKVIVPFRALSRLDEAALKVVESVQLVFREKFLPDGKAVKFHLNNLRLTGGDAAEIQVITK